MALLARRNLFHDRIRFTVTLTGIVFALVLIVIQFGLFLGFTTTTSNNIDHANADLWIVFHGVGYFDTARMFSERKFYEVLAVPGVQQAEKYIQNFAYWKKADGGVENVQIIGFHPGSGLGEPWNVVHGNVLDVKLEDGIIVDDLYKDKLGVAKTGDRVEIGDHRARVVGFTHGIRSFTTSPFVYTSFKNALNYTRPEAREDQLAYILVKVAPGFTPDEVPKNLRARLTDVDVYTSEEFSRRTRFYWMFTTGAGLAVLTAALMGLVVGVAVVAQTIYAATMDEDYLARVAAAEATLSERQAELLRTVNGARSQERRAAEANMQAAKAVLENAGKEAERRRRLADRDMISRDEAERYERVYQVARAEYDRASQEFSLVDADARAEDRQHAEAAVAAAAAQLAEARAYFEKTYVRSPIDGVILRKFRHAGESVSAQLDSPIVTLADDSVLRVRLDVDETDVARLRVGQPAFVTAEAYGPKKFTGRIIRVGRILGKKNVRTDEPSERVDTKILETLVQLDRGQSLPLGLRVDSYGTDRNPGARALVVCPY
jgi:putative ABC transport system permease protein